VKCLGGIKYSTGKKIKYSLPPVTSFRTQCINWHYRQPIHKSRAYCEICGCEYVSLCGPPANAAKRGIWTATSLPTYII